MPGPEEVVLTTKNARGYLQSLGLLTASRQVAVMVMAGQSNVLSAGYIPQFLGTGNTLDTLQPSVMGAFADVFILNPATMGFVPLEAGVTNLGYGPNGSIGPEMGFAYRWREQNPGVPLYIIKQSIPGVPISTWDDGQPGWLQFSSYIDGGKNALLLAGLTPIMIGLWWMQGESNGGDVYYASKLQNLIDRAFSRKLLTVDTKVAIGQARNDATVTAQQQLFCTRNKWYAKYVPTAGYRMNTDLLHYTAWAQFLSGDTDIYNVIKGTSFAYRFPM